MNHILTKPILILLASMIMATMMPIPLSAEGLVNTAVNVEIEANVDVSAADIGVSSETQVNAAAFEKTETETVSGTLIEIGNTTADQITIIVRTTGEGGTTEDVTLEVVASTTLQTETGASASLSGWIAGDKITFTATHYTKPIVDNCQHGRCAIAPSSADTKE